MRFIVRRKVKNYRVSYFETDEEFRRYIVGQRRLKDLNLTVTDICYNRDAFEGKGAYEVSLTNMDSFRVGRKLGTHDAQGEYDVDRRTGYYSPRNHDSGSTMKFGWWS